MGPAEPGAVPGVSGPVGGGARLLFYEEGAGRAGSGERAALFDDCDFVPLVFQESLPAADGESAVGKLVLRRKKPQRRGQGPPRRQGAQVFYLQELQDHLPGSHGQGENCDYLPQVRGGDQGEDLNKIKRPEDASPSVFSMLLESAGAHLRHRKYSPY